ncbi:hypothetical protein AVEN_208251-1 [Araneus ventricosus]|uniref:Uncharacterized protein n=1 Tax=Araneus ventricosus TaxID=182803 RepID=A0A4Y2LQD5_ARAVE|nr:hypothetical protein AVEN_208251-1 [Araneus ventricosus]
MPRENIRNSTRHKFKSLIKESLSVSGRLAQVALAIRVGSLAVFNVVSPVCARENQNVSRLALLIRSYFMYLSGYNGNFEGVSLHRNAAFFQLLECVLEFHF